MPKAAALSTTGVLTLALVLGLGGGVGGAIAVSAITDANAQNASATPGRDGEHGATGPRGDNGKDGAKGRDGTDGVDGRFGSPGATGPAGSPGTTGLTGPQGAKGDAGANGLPGSAGATGPAGTQGPQGAPGAPGPAGAQGPTGDPGPAGASGPAGANASSRYTVLTGQPTFLQGLNRVDFTDEKSSVQPAALLANGHILLPEAGTYRIVYVAAPVAADAATISVSRDAAAAYALRHNGNQIAASVVQRPMFDVNVALVLTLRTMIQGGSYSSTNYITATAGDTIDFTYTSDFTVVERKTNVILIIEKLD